MNRFTVELMYAGMIRKDVWCFFSPTESFPADFQAFDCTDTPPCGEVVWVTDSTQALVAYDYLLENGWELDTEQDAPEQLVFLDLLNATADK